MEIIPERHLEPSVELDFESKPELEEVDEEVYHDVKEDPDVDFLQESSSSEEEGEEEDSRSETESESETEGEKEKVIEKEIDFEEMDEETLLEFSNKILKGLWKYEKEECKDHPLFFYKQYHFHSQSIWETKMMQNEIIFSTRIQDPFLIQLSLYFFQIKMDRNIQMVEKIRHDIISEVLDWKKSHKPFQKRYAMIEKKHICQLMFLLQISRRDLVQMIYDTNVFESSDFYQFEIDEDSQCFIEKVEDKSVSSDFHQIPIFGCQIYTLKDILHLS